MALALVQARAVNAGGLNSSTLAFSSPVTAGNHLMCWIWGGTNGSVQTASDNVNGSYTQDASLGSAAASIQCSMNSFNNTSAGTPTVTFTNSGAGQLRAIIAEFSGIQVGSATDQTGGQTYSLTLIPSSGNITTTNATDAILGGLFNAASGGTITAGTNIPFTVFNGISSQLNMEYGSTSSAGAVSANFNSTQSETGVCLVCSYKLIGGSPAVPENSEIIVPMTTGPCITF